MSKLNVQKWSNELIKCSKKKGDRKVCLLEMFVNSDCLLRWLERNRVDNGAAIREHYINWSRVFACPHQLQVVQMSVMTRVIAKCHVCEEHLITCLTSDEHITLDHSIILFKWRCPVMMFLVMHPIAIALKLTFLAKSSRFSRCTWPKPH